MSGNGWRLTSVGSASGRGHDAPERKQYWEGLEGGRSRDHDIRYGTAFDVLTDTDTAHTGFFQRPDYNPSAAPVVVADARLQTGPNLGFFSVPPFGRGEIWPQ